MQPSRVGANFQVEIFDWNQLEQSKSLGSAKIDLEDLEPFVATERTLTLSSEKRGHKGQVIISMVFQPEIIAKSRKNTSTFSAAGRTMTVIGNAPLNAGKGVFQGVAGIFKRGKESDDDFFALGAQPEPKAVIPDKSGIQVSQSLGDGEHLVAPAVASSGVIGHTAPLEHGTLRVLVLDAKDLIGGSDVKPYAIVRIGDKEHKTKHAGKTVSPEWYVSLYARFFYLASFALGTRPLTSLLDPPLLNSMSPSSTTRPLAKINLWERPKSMQADYFVDHSLKSDSLSPRFCNMSNQRATL